MAGFGAPSTGRFCAPHDTRRFNRDERQGHRAPSPTRWKLPRGLPNSSGTHLRAGDSHRALRRSLPGLGRTPISLGRGLESRIWRIAGFLGGGTHPVAPTATGSLTTTCELAKDGFTGIPNSPSTAARAASIFGYRTSRYP